MKVIDLDTAEGVALWVKGLPTENLKAIAARPVFVCEAGSNVLLLLAADCELILRGEK
jgi:hypothetical protein